MNVFVKLCTSFHRLAVIVVFFCFLLKDEKKKDIGAIMVGFAVLMFGMEIHDDVELNCWQMYRNLPVF